MVSPAPLARPHSTLGLDPDRAGPAVPPPGPTRPDPTTAQPDPTTAQPDPRPAGSDASRQTWDHGQTRPTPAPANHHHSADRPAPEPPGTAAGPPPDDPANSDPPAPDNPDDDGTPAPDGLGGLELCRVMVAYDTAVAVDQVSLRVGPGEIVALVGPSGSGKSSLLRAVAGLEPLADGWIAWDGADIGRLPVNRRGFVLMFQDGQLFPHLSVAGNVAYGLTGLPRRERRRRVDGLLKLVGLAGFGRRRVTALSGGQAQRVALARSLGPRPKLLLLDEPLAALDPGLRQHLVTVLGDSLRATATPALYVTHDLDEAFALADKVAVLIDGRLLQVGAPDELWRQPADRQVAQFLGYGPFLDIAQAAGLGLTIPPGRRLGLGPRGLQPDRHGLALPVLATRPGRGVVEAVVRLPAGATARLSLPQPPGATVLVRLDPDGCCLVPAD